MSSDHQRKIRFGNGDRMDPKPLVESVDYPDFISTFVKQKLAQLDLEATDEMSLYITQDVESYLLDSGKTVNQLTEAEIFHIDRFVRDRINGVDSI